jgi:4-amino-4-deoxy-L-arabinose transferase-like glycosyltransferase
LDQGSIASSDDALYAQMAREMANSGRWLTATWLGVEVFEKPPLLLWMLRTLGPWFQWSEFGLRLPGVLGGLVALYYVVRLTHAETSSALAGAVAGLATMATVTFTLNARRPMTDPLLCAAVMGSVWYTAQVIRLPRRGAALGLGVAGGLGILAKWVAMGPVALVCGAALIGSRRWSSLAIASLTALLVAGPWFIAMTVTHGHSFWEVFLGYHVLDRAGGALVGAEPVTFYGETLWRLDGGFGVLLLSGLVAAVALRRSLTTALVVGTACVTLAAIHLSSTRLYHYLMPVIPLAAVALTVAAARRREALIGLGLVSLVAFGVGPLTPTLLRPDFAPTSKLLGVSLRSAPEGAEVICWEDYDPALTWYAERPIRLWTQSESMAAVQNSVDMMRRTEAVIFATPERLHALGQSAPPIFVVAPRARALGLFRWVQGLTHRRVAVDAESMESHVIVKLGPLT